ncbi:DUF1993 domain-containing protein [Lysobacter sp. KIS68-7]|uniref:DUF1993 domain-containing protein n=1 Tax=Lysobacter sp. KIS68-7 TaxID=2904252 RepID=UPI001E2F617B|nr:DUF1993 domain-containing protein [Lysobacter sp. KIS68-7]UHQ20163.1 DUF1993 domain-containing protein [Lysobacter sp. KIS68-7]
MVHSMHQFSVPVFVRALRNLRGVLQIGEKFIVEKGIAPEVMLATRLMPDMLPLVRQVQIATDMAKNCCARLTATEPMPFPDDEKTFEDLYARIDRCIDYIEGFAADQFEDAASRAISFKTRAGDLNFDGFGYLTSFVLPNLFFHASIAYAILREAGAPLGKNDFLGGAGR